MPIFCQAASFLDISLIDVVNKFKNKYTRNYFITWNNFFKANSMS